MNKLKQMKWFREIGMLADDERNRCRHPEIDNEHLFLALVNIGGPVSDAFAAAGINLDATRDAFGNLHSRRLASIGVHDSPTVDRPRNVPRGGFVFRADVRPMLEGAARQAKPDLALLDALLAEPSGHIREVLTEMGVDPAQLRGSIDDRPPTSSEEKPWVYHRFVAVPPERAWTLLSDPQRWDEWHPVLRDGEVSTLTPAGVVRVEQHLPDEATPRQHANAQRALREYVIIRREPQRLVEWGCRFPNAPRTQVRSYAVRISISPTGAGSAIQLTYLRGDRVPIRTPLQLAVRPLRGLIGPFAIRAFLRRTADDISHALRL